VSELGYQRGDEAAGLTAQPAELEEHVRPSHRLHEPILPRKIGNVQGGSGAGAGDGDLSLPQEHLPVPGYSRVPFQADGELATWHLCGHVPSRSAHSHDHDYLWSHKLINTLIGYGIFTAPAEISIHPGGHGRPS